MLSMTDLVRLLHISAVTVLLQVYLKDCMTSTFHLVLRKSLCKQSKHFTMIQLILGEIQNQMALKDLETRHPLCCVVLLQLYSKILQETVQKF